MNDRPRSPIPDPRSPAWDDMVLVGRIAKPHGLRGDVVVNPETDFVEERFAAGATLWTRSDGGEETLTIASVRVQNGRPIIGFDGFTRVEDAERLAGLELRVPEHALQPLAEHTYYQHQLVACAVETSRGERVGSVARVDGGIGGSLLVVSGDRGEILVPLTQAICVEIDVGAKRIRIDPPEGLLELNKTRGKRQPQGPAEAGPHDRPQGT
ncbi:MAG TPA: ribosome maturation factor RimM [Vicinamibacterales bacterium]